jgi:hypothetical protein
MKLEMAARFSWDLTEAIIARFRAKLAAKAARDVT